MMVAFLQDMFARFQGEFSHWHAETNRGRATARPLAQAVEYVVNETYPGMRAIPGYAGHLRGPVAAALQHVDELVDHIPGVFTCCADTFHDDPRVNAFFVNPGHIGEVFSHSRDVRELFEGHPGVTDCYALLCMQRRVRRKCAAALVGDEVRKDVMQTAVSFSDHQVVSPGTSESDARHALKCCMFNGLLGHIRKRAAEARTELTELENRERVLRNRLRLMQQGHHGPGSTDVLETELRSVTSALSNQDPRLMTLGDHLAFVGDVLSHPSRFIDARFESLHLSRTGFLQEAGSRESGYALTISEIQITSHPLRVAALVRFPRRELLPEQDFLSRADLFLQT